MARYHPLLVALHWTLAALITVNLLMGFFRLNEIDNADPAKIDALRTHMIIGGLILVLMIVRTITRIRSTKPPEPDSGSALLNRIARPIHYVIYAVIFGAAFSGMALSAMAGLPPIIFGGSGDPLPESFDIYAPMLAHWLFGIVLAALIAVHLAAVIYHEAIRRTDLLARMWWEDKQP
ncbi:MAG: cytochrome b/b6 domain-containing protein [Devosiaceae bacterium]|nr:cytochrome b/b6 domain-containing protein [Devosiaceae bacterium MH13]